MKWRSIWFILLSSLPLAIAAGFVSLSGCSSVPSRKPSSLETAINQKHANSLIAIEPELTSLETDEVLVPTRFLKSLLKSEKKKEEKYRKINRQLEALKSIDSEESGR